MADDFNHFWLAGKAGGAIKQLRESSGAKISIGGTGLFLFFNLL